MTEIKPATDADVSYWEKVASDTPFDLTFFQLIARIRQEQRRAEAAERVAEAARRLIEPSREITGQRRAVVIHGGTEHVAGSPCPVCEAYAAYDAAKAAGFPKEG